MQFPGSHNTNDSEKLQRGGDKCMADATLECMCWFQAPSCGFCESAARRRSTWSNDNWIKLRLVGSRPPRATNTQKSPEYARPARLSAVAPAKLSPWILNRLS